MAYKKRSKPVVVHNHITTGSSNTKRVLLIVIALLLAVFVAVGAVSCNKKEEDKGFFDWLTGIFQVKEPEPIPPVQDKTDEVLTFDEETGMFDVSKLDPSAINLIDNEDTFITYRSARRSKNIGVFTYKYEVVDELHAIDFKFYTNPELTEAMYSLIYFDEYKVYFTLVNTNAIYYDAEGIITNNLIMDKWNVYYGSNFNGDEEFGKGAPITDYYKLMSDTWFYQKDSEGNVYRFKFTQEYLRILLKHYWATFDAYDIMPPQRKFGDYLFRHIIEKSDEIREEIRQERTFHTQTRTKFYVNDLFHLQVLNTDTNKYVPIDFNLTFNIVYEQFEGYGILKYAQDFWADTVVNYA